METKNYSTFIKTIFCDIDGCIFLHCGNSTDVFHLKPKLLPGVTEAFTDWCKKGYAVIITTARPESLREITAQQINEAGLFFDQLIMGLPLGARVVINDVPDPNSFKKAEAINLLVDRGMLDLDI